MGNQYFEMKVNDLEKRVSDLQMDKDGLIRTINIVSTSVEALSRKASRLEETLATKADITHVQKLIKQCEEDSQNG
ncbi:hypothetical protein ACQKFU_32545 [Bacillus mycoides]|uniref:hypothetical protein n=1 Tax=Bacillus mycoides TaxID=1405 RepID=UPI003D05110E